MGRVQDRFSLIGAVLFALLITSTSFGQRVRVPAPHKPIDPPAQKRSKWMMPQSPRSMVGGLWMTDANFKSSIYIRNVVETDPVTVTPILWLSNGKQYTLPDTTIDAAGVVIISINEALERQGVSPQATLSGYIELRYTWPWDPFCATVRNVDTAHSVIFTYALRATQPPPLNIVDPPPPPPTNIAESMWWKQQSTVSAFVTIANLSSDSATASIQVTDSQAKRIAQHDIVVSPHGMKVINLDELQSLGPGQGGIRVTSSETTDNLVISGGLQDQATGYSAVLRFAPESVQDKPVPTTVAEIGLMVGAADPMMRFPSGTTFTPYAVIRNVSDSPLSLTPMVWWMESGAARSAELPPISLQAYETGSLNVASLLAQFGPKNFNGSFNLVFTGEARRGSLLMAAGSVDQTNTYVFEVVPRGVTEGGSKSLQYWSTGNGDDTMVTVWNPADDAQDFVFTLYFKGGHYAMPLHLEPRATRTFDVSQIIQNQVPDADGNIIPASVQEGTAKIAGSQAENQHILVAVDSGIYNVRKATCNNNCQECDGYSNIVVIDDPFFVGVNGSHQEVIRGTWNTGGQYNITASWSSNNTNIATVSSGLVHGVSPGAVVITGIASNLPVGAGYICTGELGCPVMQIQSSGGGTVTKLTCTSSLVRGGSATCSVTPNGVAVSNWQFKDGSGNTVSRTQNTGSLTWSGVMVIGGTVSVTATSSGATTSLSATIVVNNRTNFSFTSVQPAKEGNPYTCTSVSGSSVISVHNPPQPNGGTNSDFIGEYCDIEDYSYDFATLSDDGPNNGYSYVTTPTNNASFHWIIAQAAENPASTFYKAQCGNYNASNNTGFISGAQLNTNTVRHESGTVQGHYGKYVATQSNSSNNVGFGLESAVNFSSGVTFQNWITGFIAPRITALKNGTALPDPFDVNHDQNGAYDGPINFSPYAVCN
jgi:hypothetical protein